MPWVPLVFGPGVCVKVCVVLRGGLFHLAANTAVKRWSPHVKSGSRERRDGEGAQRTARRHPRLGGCLVYVGCVAVMQQHEGLLRDQDHELDKLEGGIKRIKALGGVMRDELAEQAVILESLEDDVEKADTNLNTMQKKMRTMIDDAKNNDKALWSIIACLSLLLGFLTFMVLS